MLRVFNVLERQSTKWVTSAEVAAEAKGVAANGTSASSSFSSPKGHRSGRNFSSPPIPVFRIGLEA